MKIKLTFILCIVLISGFVLSGPNKSHKCIKAFVKDVSLLDNETIMTNYFADIVKRDYVHIDPTWVIMSYQEKLTEIRTNIIATKKILIEVIEARIFKVTQNNYSFLLKLRNEVDSIESIIPVTKGIKIIDWL